MAASTPVMVFATGYSSREKTASALIRAAASSMAGISKEALSPVRDDLNFAERSAPPTASAARTMAAISASSPRHASEKDDVAFFSARRLGSRPSAIRLIWVGVGADPCGTSANSLLMTVLKASMASPKALACCSRAGRCSDSIV